MKLRILSEPKYDLWSGKYQQRFLVQKKVLFWWETLITYNDVCYAESYVESYVESYLERKRTIKNKPDTKVLLEVEV